MPLEDDSLHAKNMVPLKDDPTPLHEARSQYADAFIQRCTRVDHKDPNLQADCTYISLWLATESESDTVDINVYKCLVCHKLIKTRQEYKARNIRNCHPGCEERILKTMDEITNGRELVDLPNQECAKWSKLFDIWNNAIEYVETQRVSKTQIHGLRLMANEFNMYRLLANEFNMYNDVWAMPGSTLIGNRNMHFGKTCFQASLLSSSKTIASISQLFAPSLLQVTWNSRYFVSSQSSDKYVGLVYCKDFVWAFKQRLIINDSEEPYEDSSKTVCGQDEAGNYEWHEPTTPCWRVPLDGVNPAIKKASSLTPIERHGGPQSDVFSILTPELVPQIRPALDALAFKTNDCPIPRYQMIIDPNQCVRARQDSRKVWVPCEFDIGSNGRSVELVGGDRAHWMGEEIIETVATPVLTKALPLLAELTKPYMLLEGQRLQVVVKAQSITVPKKQEEDDEPEYVGLWHVDGDLEPVAAVVLYYYDVDEALVGGNMEFLDRRPMDVLGYGDTNLPRNFDKGSLKEALIPKDKNSAAAIPNCSVPVETGSLLVFSNYQMAHRVLRMVNTSQSRSASRKFVALFVMDPAADRLVPARAHLAHSYLYTRALTGKCPLLGRTAGLPQAVATLVLQYLGIVPSEKQRRLIRNEMLRCQLIPKSHLAGAKALLCSTGNGCQTMIGWIDNLLKTDEVSERRERLAYVGNNDDDDDDPCNFNRAYRRINALNVPPSTVGRGLSETFSTPTDDLKHDDFLDTLETMKAKLPLD